jgi:hypothetical protein
MAILRIRRHIRNSDKAGVRQVRKLQMGHWDARYENQSNESLCPKSLLSFAFWEISLWACKYLLSHVFWRVLYSGIITPCSPLKVNRHFEGIMPPSLGWKNQLAKNKHEAGSAAALLHARFLSAYFSRQKMEAICFSETSIDFQRTTRRYVAEYSTVHNHGCENMKSYTHVLISLYDSHSYLPSRVTECHYPERDNTVLDRVWMLAGILLCPSFLCSSTGHRYPLAVCSNRSWPLPLTFLSICRS